MCLENTRLRRYSSFHQHNWHRYRFLRKTHSHRCIDLARIYYLTSSSLPDSHIEAIGFYNSSNCDSEESDSDEDSGRVNFVKKYNRQNVSSQDSPKKVDTFHSYPILYTAYSSLINCVTKITGLFVTALSINTVTLTTRSHPV